MIIYNIISFSCFFIILHENNQFEKILLIFIILVKQIDIIFHYFENRFYYKIQLIIKDLNMIYQFIFLFNDF